MFVSAEGGLFTDDLESVRPDYRRHYRRIRNGRELRSTLRAGRYAWPGGYPLYFIAFDGEALSWDTVLAELPNVLDAIRRQDNSGWRVVGCEVNWEDDSLFCAHSGERIPSAYLNPTP